MSNKDQVAKGPAVRIGMKRSLYYVGLTVVAVVLVGYLLVHGGLTPPHKGSVDRAAQALVTGQVVNFTLADAAKPAPEVSFADAADARRTLTDFKGKVVLLNFWATWCGPCVREMPALAKLNAELGGPDFAVIALAGDRQGLPVVQDFYRKHALEGLPIYVDPSNVAPRKFQVVGLPTTVLVGRDGRELGRLVGPAEWDSEDAKKLIRHFIAKGAP